MWTVAISDAVRARVLRTLRENQRNPAWMARVIGKSRAWSTDFKQGRGDLSHVEMKRLAEALGVTEAYLWEGVSQTSTTSTAPATSSIVPAARDSALSNGGDMQHPWVQWLAYKLDGLDPDQRRQAEAHLEDALRSFTHGGVKTPGHLPHVAKHKR